MRKKHFQVKKIFCTNGNIECPEIQRQGKDPDCRKCKTISHAVREYLE